MTETKTFDGSEYDPSWITGKALDRHFDMQEALLEFSRLFRDEKNDRALAIVGGAFLDVLLEKPPVWADVLRPNALPARDFFRQLHCTLPINGGARENWPRVGLEAFAAGVPVVAQNEWGWREMIEHGVTGFLGSCDEELAHYTAMLAYDEDLRMRIHGRNWSAHLKHRSRLMRACEDWLTGVAP